MIISSLPADTTDASPAAADPTTDKATSLAAPDAGPTAGLAANILLVLADNIVDSLDVGAGEEVAATLFPHAAVVGRLWET